MGAYGRFSSAWPDSFGFTLPKINIAGTDDCSLKQTSVSIAPPDLLFWHI